MIKPNLKKLPYEFIEEEDYSWMSYEEQMYERRHEEGYREEKKNMRSKLNNFRNTSMRSQKHSQRGGKKNQ